jgi:hypothetical protein
MAQVQHLEAAKWDAVISRKKLASRVSFLWCWSARDGGNERRLHTQISFHSAPEFRNSELSYPAIFNSHMRVTDINHRRKYKSRLPRFRCDLVAISLELALRSSLTNLRRTPVEIRANIYGTPAGGGFRRRITTTRDRERVRRGECKCPGSRQDHRQVACNPENSAISGMINHFTSVIRRCSYTASAIF